MDALSDLHRRWLLVLTVAVAAAGATAAFSFTTAKHYRATAVVVVQPTPPKDLLGLDVLHDTSRRTAAATAARLVRDDAVAQRVSDRLGLGISGAALLDKVSTGVVPHTDAVEVTVTDTRPARAAQIANGLVDGFLADRAVTFGSQVHSALAKLRTRIATLTPAQRAGPQGRELAAAIGGLQRWVGFGDPTVAHGPAAVEPQGAAWPHPFWWTLYGGLIGIGGGILAAVGLDAIAAARRRRLVEAAEYDRSIPERGSERPPDRGAERLVERLERRLAERLDALAAEQTRLAAREASLETREREVTAKLAELREAAGEGRPAAPEAADAGRLEELAAREAELEEREERLREVGDELAVREQELAARVEAATRRERAIAARAAELQEVESRLDERREALEREAAERREVPPEPVSEPAPAPEPATEPEPSPAPPPAAAPNGGWRLAELEQLVEANAGDRPERADEWRSYLFYLRDYVDAAGRVPAHFDWLIEDTFGDLLARR